METKVVGQTALDKAREYLLSLQDSKEGWFAYKPGGDASMEATAWASLALRDNAEVRQKAFAFLQQNQNQDGGWSTKPEAGRSDWCSAPALLAMRVLRADENSRKENRSINSGLDYLLDSRYTHKPATRLVMLVSKGSSSLDKDRGWPWDPDCFHWIEPTAYALLALKLPQLPQGKDSAEVQHAVMKGNNFILDHACKGGGWNHGNDITLGAYLPAYRLTTAEALLALQDLRDDAKVKDGLDYLISWQDKDTSCLSLAMTILALTAYSQQAAKEVNFLLARQTKESGNFTQNTVTTALSALALEASLTGKSILYVR